MKKQLKLKKLLVLSGVLLVVFGQTTPVIAVVEENFPDHQTPEFSSVEEKKDSETSETVGNEVEENSEERPPLGSVDRTNLDKLIQEAELLVNQVEIYTDAYRSRLKEAISLAKADQIGQESIDYQIEVLAVLIAEKDLSEHQLSQAMVDKMTLQEVVHSVSGILNHDYTDESLAVLHDVLRIAQEVLSRDNADQIEVDQAVKQLQLAITKLQLKPTQSTPAAPSEIAEAEPTPANTLGQVENSNVVTYDNKGIDKELLTADSLTESDLNGYELPILQSFEDQRRAAIIASALKNLGKPYQAEANGPDYFDNLNFVCDAYQQVFDLDLRANFDTLVNSGEKIILSEAQPGDLLFWSGEEMKAAIYLGSGKYIMADDQNLAERKIQAEEEAAAQRKKAEENGETWDEEITIPGVEIFTLFGYQENAEVVLIDDETANELVAESEQSPLLKKYLRRNPDFAVGLNSDYQLSDVGKQLLASYSASTEFRVNEKTEDFIETIGETARSLGQEHGVYASVMIAQAILESGSGSSGLSRAPYYNLFGIKGNYQGNSVTMSTQEDNGRGALYTISSAFRNYGSYKESLTDYVQLIKGGISENELFYEGAWRSEAKNYLQATEYLTGRYATDTRYANKLNSIISVYALTRFDEPRCDTESAVILQSREEIPAAYRNKMVFPEYNGVDYNTTGSYPVGQCTWYVYNRVRQLGGSFDNHMGNGNQWGTKGARLGYHTTSIPRVGYGISFQPGVAGADAQYGHVAFVEVVGPDGILISEANVVGGNAVSCRVISNEIARSEQVTYIVPK